MRVLVTGGTGNVGTATVEHLVAQGWDVRAIGRRQDIEMARAEYHVCDITCYDDLREQMQGCQAVVHLAAIPGPGRSPGHEVFRVNVAGTMNVFEAAHAEGIRRVVQASSINAFGCFYNVDDLVPQYLPIDEDHPPRTSDPYSFSKQLVEEIGAYYWRRERMSSVALRLPAVWPSSRIADPERLARVQEDRAIIDSLAALPESDRRVRLAEISARAREIRSKRPFEQRKDALWIAWRQELEQDRLLGIYTFDRFNFWTAIDERDAAQAVQKGLAADFEGSHVLFVNDCHNWLGYEAQQLARLFFGDVDEWRAPLDGPVSLVSMERARDLIGFEPVHALVAPDAAPSPGGVQS